MSNTNALWKTVLLTFSLIVGALFALPNLLGTDPAVQISYRNGTLPNDVISQVQISLDKAGFKEANYRQDDKQLTVLFDNENDQIRARDTLLEDLNPKTTSVALNLVSASPAWLRAFADPMYLGLDLRGGVHFLMQVDLAEAKNSAEVRYISSWKQLTRDAKVRGSSIQHEQGKLVARFNNTADRDVMLTKFREDGRALDFTTREDGGYAYIDANLNKAAEQSERSSAIEQNVVTLRNRVNELGVAEPVIQQQGQDRIVVQLPGIQDTARAKQILGATATLEYRLVYEHPGEWNEKTGGAVPAGAYLSHLREDGSAILLNRDIIVTGDQIKGASSGIDQQSGTPEVSVTLDNDGAHRMQLVTEQNIGNPMAVIYREDRVETKVVDGKTIREVKKTEEVISVATIKDVLSHRFQTTGLKMGEAKDLALLLRSGSLRAPVQIVEERTIGPSLGKHNIERGFQSAVAGIALVIIAMTVHYGVFGLISGIALGFNVVFIIAVLSMLQATLTLPGIAGIVLTMGMAVDANVLIYERIREELRAGKRVQMAIANGYDRAFSTIADANITTLIAGIVLFMMGTGPVKGFAITLSIGILTSMYTAIFGSRVIVNALYGGRRIDKLPIFGLFSSNKPLAVQTVPARKTASTLVESTSGGRFNFMGRKKFALALSGTLLVISVLAIGIRGLNYSVDFTGGYSIELGYDAPPDLELIRKTLTDAQLLNAQVQIFGTSKDVLVRLAPREGSSSATLSDEVLTAVKSTSSAPIELRRVEYVGPQVGKELREKGGMALLISLFAIIIYVWIRFEKKLALGSVLALIHDVTITLGVFAIFQLEFDLTIIAALLALIGYSLNDSIVVFDRIRENFRTLRRGTTEFIMNQAINETLSRTIMTSVMTLVALFSLLIFGGEVLYGFSIALIVGIFVGTYSSIFVASMLGLALDITKEDLLPIVSEAKDSSIIHSQV